MWYTSHNLIMLSIPVFRNLRLSLGIRPINARVLIAVQTVDDVRVRWGFS